ncbi:MAG: type II toxin-antitoxin system VapC family toxin [Jatrophihabitantaceae bacterium]
MIVYFDSSALVKLVVEEPDSDQATRLWAGSELAVSSRLAHPEVRSARAAARRDHRLSEAALDAAVQAWGRIWASIRPIGLTARIEQDAGDLVGPQALSGADAVHLASALAFDDTGLLFAAWDRRLRAGAVAAGLTVVPN